MTALAIAPAPSRRRSRTVEQAVDEALRYKEDLAWANRMLKLGRRGLVALIEFSRNWNTGHNVSRLYHDMTLVEVFTKEVGFVNSVHLDVLLKETTLSEAELALIVDLKPRAVRQRLAQVTHDEGPVFDGNGVERKLPTSKDRVLSGQTPAEMVIESVDNFVTLVNAIYPTKKVPAKDRTEIAAAIAWMNKELAFLTR